MQTLLVAGFALAPLVPTAGAFVVSPDKKTVVTGDGSTQVKAWDLAKGDLRFSGAHTDLIWHVAVAPDSKRVASAAADQYLKVWDARAGRLMWERKHPAEVRSTHYSHDGKQLFSGSNDGTVWAWDAKNGDELWSGRAPDKLLNMRLSPDGTKVLGSYMFSARLWDTLTGREEWSHQHGGVYGDEVFAPGGRSIVVGSHKGAVALFELPSQQARWTKQLGSQVWDLLFSPDGKQVLVYLSRNELKLHDGAEGKELWSYLHPTKWSRVAFDPDGRHFRCAFVDGSLHTWSTKSRKLVRKDTFPAPAGDAASELHFALTPNSKQLAVYYWTAKQLEVLDAASGKRKWGTRLGGEISGVEASPDGKYWIVRTYDAIQVFKVKRGKRLWKGQHEVLVRG